MSAKIITSAKNWQILVVLFGNTILERRREVLKLSSGCAAIDELLGGGFETQSICEVYGEFGSGKTQVGHQLAVNCLLPKEQGGWWRVFYMTLKTHSVLKNCSNGSRVGMDPEVALERIHVARAYNSAHQMLLVDEIQRASKNIDVKLIIVDSLIAHFRAEFLGRGMLADRQQKLNRHMKELKKLADVNNAMVLVTNQVMSKPDAMWGDPTKPVGGHVVGHASTFRLYLRKSKAGSRIARLVDSPNLPEGEAKFFVTADGLRD